MDIFLKILGFLAIGGLVLAVVVMVRSLGKALPVRLRRQLTEVGMSVVVLVVYVAILGVTPVGWLSALLFALGLAVGYLTSRSVGLELRDGDVLSRRSTWYLILWVATIAITQFLALFSSWGAVAFGVATVYFSTAVVVGRNGTLLVRRAGLLRGEGQSAPVLGGEGQSAGLLGGEGQSAGLPRGEGQSAGLSRREGRSWAVGDLDSLGTEIAGGAGVGEGPRTARSPEATAPERASAEGAAATGDPTTGPPAVAPAPAQAPAPSAAPPASPATGFRDRFCPRCGAPFGGDASVCASCGAKRN